MNNDAQRNLGLLGLVALMGFAASVSAEDQVMAKDSEARAILDSVRVPEAQRQKDRQLDQLYWEDFIQPYMGQTCALAACHGGNRAGRLHFERPDINGAIHAGTDKSEL